MKTIRILSFIFLIVSFIVMAVNAFIYPLPVWAIRVDGVIMLICLAITAYISTKNAVPKN